MEGDLGVGTGGVTVGQEGRDGWVLMVGLGLGGER